MKHNPIAIDQITKKILNGSEVTKQEIAMVCEHVTELNRVVKNLKLCPTCNQPLDGFGGNYCNLPHSAKRMKYVIGKLCDTVEDLAAIQGGPKTEIDTHIALILGRLGRLATMPPS